MFGGEVAAAQKMTGEAKRQRMYEERVVSDSPAQLAERSSLKELPLSQEELRNLAARARESFKNPEKGRARFANYKAHLSSIYGAEVVERTSSELEVINNRIGYEEK